MDSKSQNLFIFLVIALICSTTPVTAIEMGNQRDNVSFDWHSTWTDTVSKVFNLASNDMGTELTQEQHDYMEERQDLIENKSNNLLNDTQILLDYAILKYSRYSLKNNSRISSKMGDDFSDSLQDIKNHLNKARYPVNTGSYTYDNLSSYCNNIRNDTNNTNVTGLIIVQIADNKDNNYVRYMELDSINRTHICLHSPKLNKVINRAQFENVNMKDDNINIIIIDPDYNRSDVENSILEYQKSELTFDSRFFTGCTSFAGVATGVATAVMGYGLREMCLTCRHEVVASDVEMQIQEELWVPMDSSTSLLQNRTKTVTQQVQERVCVNCKRPVTVLITGLVAASVLLSATGVFLYITTCCDIEKENLQKY